MRHGILSGAMIVLLAGCSATLATRGGSPIDEGSYNREIERQGLSHYCQDGICDTLPKLKSGRAPAYPSTAFAARLSGTAVIVFDIDEDGRTQNLTVESATAPEFAQAALDAVATWRFSPAKLRGTPVKINARQAFPFSL